MTLKAVPFTLCSSLLWNAQVGERARGGSIATTHGNPGSRR
ncbi:hypothetical protein P4909_18790 [Escherichia coli]